MIIGGRSRLLQTYTSTKTFQYDHKQGSWSGGPSLKQPRHDHAVGIVFDEVTKDKIVLVTGGSCCYDFDNGMKSTELFWDKSWSAGEEIANPIGQSISNLQGPPYIWPLPKLFKFSPPFQMNSDTNEISIEGTNKHLLES